MEPCWIAMGQAAGVAASIAIDSKLKIKNVNIATVQDLLTGQKATLIYYKDLGPDDADFKMVQYTGLRGYLPSWEAKLNQPVDAATVLLWEGLCRKKLNFNEGVSRRELLTKIYKGV